MRDRTDLMMGEVDERTVAKFAHLAEAKRQQEVEERGRAETADLDE